MAKTPRKGQPFRQKTANTTLGASSKSTKPHQYGGKNFKNIKKQFSKSRRFSLAESSSDSSDSLPKRLALNLYDLNSDSDSSLTALSEQDEDPQQMTSGKSVSRHSGLKTVASSSSRPYVSNTRSAKSTKSTKSVRKRVSTKSHFKDDVDNFDDAAISDDADEDEINEESFALGLYSMMETNDSNSLGSETSDESQDNGNDSSSSDDSEVDFVRLQAKQRMNNLKAIKGLPANSKELMAKGQSRRRSTALRKRSEVVLPDDINFQFDFDLSRRASVFDDDSNDEIVEAVQTVKEKKLDEEEDIGEEVKETGERPEFDFQFDEPFIDVPKIKEDELNSDDDYEFDDNDLLATIQADNDLDEFLPSNPSDKIRTRQSSMSSVNDDNEDPFLREEEKFLVNEFEVNGFDDENDPSSNDTAKIMESFVTGSQDDQVLQYASSSDDDLTRSDLDTLTLDFDNDEEEADEYIDFIDDASKISKSISVENTKQASNFKGSDAQKAHFMKKRRPKRGPLESEEDDDSYLWNYFFSSDAESEVDEKDLEQFDLEEQFLLEEVFRKDFEEKQKQLGREATVMEIQDDKFESGYDSGESTDVDLSLPSSGSGSKVGSKLAKEVLSSRTADYRPPVLGTWVAIDTKPFSIIDGLSTRTLTSHNLQRNPRSKNWKSFSLNHDSEDLAIDLEELLNVSELDNDDENDVRIWRDFNNNKKHVPLGAFRNKSKMHHSHIAEPLAGYNVSKMNTGISGRRSLQVRAKLAAQRELESLSNASLVKELTIPSKLRRRRASIADAVSEGYRPTKSGLFSENVLADVEEVMGDDRDFMALIKGL